MVFYHSHLAVITHVLSHREAIVCSLRRILRGNCCNQLSKSGPMTQLSSQISCGVPIYLVYRVQNDHSTDCKMTTQPREMGFGDVKKARIKIQKALISILVLIGLNRDERLGIKLVTRPTSDNQGSKFSGRSNKTFRGQQ